MDPESKKLRRHHIDETTVRKAIKQAAKLAKIQKMLPAIHYGTRSLPTYLNLVQIYAPYKNNLAIAMFAPRKYIRMFYNKARSG